MSDNKPETPGDAAPGEGAAPKQRRPGLANLAARGRRPATAPSPRGAAAIVNGLDRRESTIGVVLSVIGLLLALVGYHVLQHSTDKTLRPEATVFLVATLVGTALVALGTGLRRRALLGFGCFLVGLELFTYRLTLEGLVYLAVGGWLIFRVMQSKKLAAGAGSPRRTAAARQGASSAPRAPAGRPKASKRYTPPKRTAAGRRR